MLRKEQTSATFQNMLIMIIWCVMSIKWCRIQNATNIIKFLEIIYCIWRIQKEQPPSSRNSSLTSLNLFHSTPFLIILINFNRYEKIKILPIVFKHFEIISSPRSIRCTERGYTSLLGYKVADANETVALLVIIWTEYFDRKISIDKVIEAYNNYEFDANKDFPGNVCWEEASVPRSFITHLQWEQKWFWQSEIAMKFGKKVLRISGSKKRREMFYRSKHKWTRKWSEFISTKRH